MHLQEGFVTGRNTCLRLWCKHSLEDQQIYTEGFFPRLESLRLVSATLNQTRVKGEEFFEIMFCQVIRVKLKGALDSKYTSLVQ